ncbi:MAG: sulfite exporter TauE/SafE family protein [Terracidiphilus sp.]
MVPASVILAAGPPLDWRWIWLVTAAFLAGLLNAIAGGGSFLLFPAMLGMRMLPIQANATNTVALWPGQLTSVAAYWQDIRKNLRLAVPMALAGLVGGAGGALVLLSTPQMTFLHMVPWLLLTAAGIFAVSGPVTRWLERRKLARHTGPAAPPRVPRRLAVFASTAAVCFYIGYFGAGAGFLLITLMSLFGLEDLHEINGLKVAATTPANGIAFVLFVVNGQVLWRYCLPAMCVCAVGGYASARLAKRVRQPFLRGLVVFIGLAMAAWFFWRNP